MEEGGQAKADQDYTSEDYIRPPVELFKLPKGYPFEKDERKDSLLDRSIGFINASDSERPYSLEEYTRPSDSFSLFPSEKLENILGKLEEGRGRNYKTPEITVGPFDFKAFYKKQPYTTTKPGVTQQKESRGFNIKAEELLTGEILGADVTLGGELSSTKKIKKRIKDSIRDKIESTARSQGLKLGVKTPDVGDFGIQFTRTKSGVKGKPRTSKKEGEFTYTYAFGRDKEGKLTAFVTAEQGKKTEVGFRVDIKDPITKILNLLSGKKQGRASGGFINMERDS